MGRSYTNCKACIECVAFCAAGNISCPCEHDDCPNDEDDVEDLGGESGILNL